MVKITIKKPVLDTERSTSDDEESDSEASDAESTESGTNESLSVSKSGRSKRKCVLNFEKKKKSKKSRKSRSKSVTPDEEEEEEEEEQFEEDKFTKQMFQCEICNKVFHSKFVMKTHAKAHRKIEKDLKCDKYYHYYLNSIN